MGRTFYFALSVILITISSSVAALETVTLQLRWLHQAQSAGFYMAKAKGLYQQAGLNVVIKPGGNNQVPLKEVLAKRADFGVGNTEVLVAYGHRFPVVALATVFQQSPSILITTENSNIQTLDDLVGKKVMMFSGTEDAELITLLAKNNIELTKLEQVTTSANIEDLISGKIDAFNGYLTNEPYYLKERGLNPLIFNPADYGINFYSDIIFTHQDLAKNNPELVDRFRQASIEGWYYALSNIEETLDVIEQRYQTNKTREHLRFELTTTAHMIMSDLIEIGRMNPNRWQQIADQLAALNMIPATTIDENFLYPLRSELTWQDIKSWVQIGAILLSLTSLAACYFLFTNNHLKKEITRRIKAEEKAERIARKDMLTGIANRYALIETLHRTVTNRKDRQPNPALLFIDLDHFKIVNDTYGHHSGDQVLQQFCYRMNGLLPENAFFARLAGDEFIVLLTTTTESQANQLAKKVAACARKPFMIGPYQIQIGASVGTTIYRSGDTPDYFLSRADSKMYGHKKRSRQERYTIQP
ncbi:ABC transporter substrate-binding protein [Pseudomonadota bacterium]